MNLFFFILFFSLIEIVLLCSKLVKIINYITQKVREQYGRTLTGRSCPHLNILDHTMYYYSLMLNQVQHEE